MRKKSVGAANRQSVYQRGNQRDGSPHYVFLYSDDESGDEEILLQPRNNANSIPRKIEVMNVTLKSDDTLQALALRYRCTISELKRINNIHKENEVFARRVIKVPIQPFSIFTENNEAPDNLLNGIENGSKEEQTSEKREEQIINLIATPIVPPATTNINSVILNSICEPSANEVDGNFDDEGDTLLRDQETTADTKVVDPFRCSGADWGLSWAHLLGFSLLLGFAGPVIYIFYIAENEHRHTAT